MTVELTSRNFADGGIIPRRHSCDGDDISPPLMWSGLPEKTRSVALFCENPDLPRGPFVHWLIYNIPVLDHTLPEGIPPWRSLGDGILQGTNDFDRIGFSGPCPPDGSHRYVFTLYALDTVLPVGPGLRRDELLSAMEGHVLGQGQLTGHYKHS